MLAALWRALGSPGQGSVLHGHDDHVWSLLVADGYVFSSSADGTIRVWRAAEPHEACATLRGHQGTVYCLALLGDRLLSGSADHTLRVWQAPRWAPAATLPCGPTLLSLAVSTELVVAGGHDGSIAVWRMGNNGAARCHLTVAAEKVDGVLR